MKECVHYLSIYFRRSEALNQSNYDADPMLQALGITISKDFTKVDGRVIQAPKLRAGNGEEFFPRNGRWNFNNKQIEEPYTVVEENHSMCRAPTGERVEKMFDEIKTRFPSVPYFLLCILPERKNSDIYGPWKRKCLSEFGIFTQCIAPIKINDQYLTNVMFKINAKLGGTNFVLQVKHSKAIPLVSRTPTIILWMDVSHGSPGQSEHSWPKGFVEFIGV